MTSFPRSWVRRAPLATWLGAALAVAGILLFAASPWFLLLSALGAFGPGALREAGLLRDHDEFQRRAAHRAGYHAFLVTGAATFALYAYTRAGGRVTAPATELSMLTIALLCCTWICSSLIATWGPRPAAFRVLVLFGSAWGAFNLLSDLAHPRMLLMQLLGTTAPFFVLAFLSRRWPRAAGVLLLALALGFAWSFWPRRHGLGLPLTKLGTYVLFVGPLLASGVALLAGGRAAGDATEPGPAGGQAA